MNAPRLPTVWLIIFAVASSSLSDLLLKQFGFAYDVFTQPFSITKVAIDSAVFIAIFIVLSFTYFKVQKLRSTKP
ncbi:hypothetical protein A1OQ_06065 [Enterovibrio norvegicus FF-162]|uniref:Uncharacterized protein n=1 Tax=Enterovibrio norvegicus FF-454 TaxID=1185651 RepID=A0A1E5CBS1_9GAMM|nr:hypothetical protein A1OK_20045 [Enterovibrio norvegicus FF-454]OEE76562.1 hypothetical protein A1OQ_06065 [Enterovibrio norvegicus FF-162]